MGPSAEQFRRLAPSALLSSRWSRDNLLTPDPARLYNGALGERVGALEVEQRVRELMARRGPFEVTTGGLGVLSWSIRCKCKTGDFLLQLPLVMDAEGVGGRSKQRVPERCFENARHFAAQGLGRYLLPGEQMLDLPGQFRGATFSLPRGYLPLTFGLGAARVDFEDAAGSWIASVGNRTTLHLTRELIAALAYHYDSETAGGTAVSDVLINDGDFLVKRDHDGAFCLRMTCARRLEQGIDRNRFLFFLVQLMAYEDWSVEDDLIGLPVPVGNPAVAFSGLVLGTGLRYEDLGKGATTGRELARTWIAEFGRSREGRAYQPWVQCFLDGSLSFDGVDDPRRPWWNLVELEQRRDLAGLQHEADRARALAELVTRLQEVIGVGTIDEGLARGVNDWDREDVVALLNRCDVREAPQAAAVEAWFAGWPYRNRRQLKNQVAALRSAGEHLAGLRVNGILPAEEDGTPRALERLPVQRPARCLANPESFPGPLLPQDLEHAATRCFPSFEAFMDDALHDPVWGYYTHRVVIGDAGHFSTNPETLTPHYGRWLAAWALEVWSELVDSGKLSARDRFPLIEFGAGNGRLARDVLDAVRAKGATDARWRAFSEALEYRIYELSDTLRQRQQELLGTEVRVLPGDARQPAAALRRDFPSGVRGFIVSNELPDAFGVHKVMFSAEGIAEAVLVVPRIEAGLQGRLPEALSARCRETDAQIRSAFGWQQHLGELLLDRASFGAVMAAIYEQPKAEAGPLLDQVWFEEVRVPASCFEPLVEVLRAGAEHYARAIGREDSGVVQYVNVHARSYIQDLAQVLAAGQIMTIDYGDTTAGLVHGARRGKFPFRIYCDEADYHPRANHPYTWPGAQDLTADVNFTDLALAGLGAGLELLYYGPERAIAGAELPRVVASADQKPFAKFVGNSVFKLLVLGRDAAWCPKGEGLEPWPVFSEDVEPEALGRPSVASIAERLVSGSGLRRRVHLRIVSDHVSGEPRLELSAPVFDEDWQNRLTLATANTAFGLLRQERSTAAASQLGTKAMDATSTLVASLLARAPTGALACRQGCAHCCHQRVGVTVPEALAIFAALVATRSTAELRQLQERVERAYHSTFGLSRDERNSPEHACPLLENDLCSIYSVRPLACRGVHSLDAGACESKLHDRERRAAYERGDLPGHSFVEPVRAVHAISAGLQLGLHEGLGLDMRPLDLTAALHLLLGEVAELKDSARNPSSSAAPDEAVAPPDGEPLLWASPRAQRWLDGLPAFAEAHGGDATDHQGQVELSGAVALAPPRREGV